MNEAHAENRVVSTKSVVKIYDQHGTLISQTEYPGQVTVVKSELPDNVTVSQAKKLDGGD